MAFHSSERLRAVKLAAMSRYRRLRVERAVSPARRTLIDVLEPRLMFSAEHPLGLAVGPADFQEHFEHLRDAQRAAITLDMLHELERESSESQMRSASGLNDIREEADISNASNVNGDTWHESAIVEFRAIDGSDTALVLDDGINPVIINVTTEIDRIDATDMSSLLAFNNGAGGDNLVSLREAITVANADPTVDVIQLPDGNYRLTLDANNWNEDGNLEGDLDIEGSYTIQGESEANTIIGQDVANRRVFEVRSGPVTFADLTISDGSLSLKENGSGESIPGAGVLVQTGDTAIFANVSFTNNDSIGDGGALWVDGNATLNNVSISGSDTERGAGIFGDVNSTVVIRDSSISNNNAGDDGGGIVIEGSLLVYDSVLDDNAVNAADASDNARGGAIWIGPDADVTIQNSVLSNNWAKSDGGAINNSGQLKLIDSDLIQNDTERTGGALRNEGVATLERVNVYGNTVVGNNVFHSGAGIINTIDGDLTITYSIVAANTSQSYAGGLSLLGTGIISDSIIINNTSQVADGGGGVLDSGSSVSLTNTVVANNTAAGVSNDVQGLEVDIGFGAIVRTANSGGFNLVETAANFDAVPTDIIGIDSGFTLSGLDDNNDTVIAIASTSATVNSGSIAGTGNTTIFGTVVGNSPNIGGYTSNTPGGMVFWSAESGSIFRSDPNFTYSQNVIDGISAPLDIEVDDVNQLIYWLDPDNHEIKSARFDGTDVIIERRVNEDAVAFAFDIDNERFFIAAENGSSSSILQYFGSDSYGTEAEERAGELVQSISGEPTDIEFDQDSNILYWSEKTDGPEDIMSVETRPFGQDPEEPVPQIVANGSSLVKDPYALTINDSSDQVFWSEPGLGLVARYTDVGGVQTLAHSEPQALAYDTFNDRLLVADNNKTIYTINSAFDTVSSSSVTVSEKVWDLSFALIQSDESDPNQVPVITSVSNISAAENQSSVITVTSTDGDSDTPIYSISGGSDDDLFAIDSSSGELTFRNAPNFEEPDDAGSDNVYDVIVQVDDGNGGTDSQSIAVTVINEDEIPVMTPMASITVENRTSVLTLISTDVDGGAPVYTKSGGADEALFTIDASSGVLTFLAAPNFEAPNDTDGNNVYEVTVQVADADGDTATQNITVTVTNEDETPVMTPMAAIIVENQTSVFTVSSTDVDGGAPVYTKSGGADEALFTVDASSGVLTFLAAPNFEAPSDTDGNNVYEVTVQVADADGDTATQNISVNIANEDEIPVMTPTVATNAAENQTSVLTLSSTDVDGGSPVYTISGGADAVLFAVDSTSGVLTFVSAPNFEAPTDADGNNVYEVTVQVADADGDTATQNITVTVTNEDEIPVMTPTVATNAVENQTSVLTVSSTDVDGGAPVYTKSGGADEAMFTIDASSGVLTFLAAPNFEASSDTDGNNVYEVTVQVADADGDTASQNITVTVTNEDEIPVMTPTVATNAAENQTSVLTVSSTDVDGGSPVYTISGGADAAVFAVDSISGVLTFVSAPNFEAPNDSDSNNVYEVTVQVADADGDTATQNVTVTVTNEDEIPVMHPTVATNVIENQISVLTVNSTDVDGGSPVYTINGGADAAVFAVDSTSGVLTFVSAPNFEAPIDADGNNVYEVTVQVADADGDTTTQNITVTVTNEDETPVMTPTVATNAAENQTSVLTVSSTDVDGGAPVYTINGGADAALFAVDSISGVLTFLSAPNFEAPTDADGNNLYEVTVQVADADGDTATQNITVTVTNEDENPVMIPTVATRAVENQTSVLTVYSTDVEGGAPVYAKSGGADAALFDIDGNSGELTFIEAPNFEAPDDTDGDNVYEVMVQVADVDGDTATQSIAVAVTNEDEIPVITSIATISAVENQTSVLTVSSSDVDGNAPTYTISGGADSALFNIDSTSGVLIFLAAPNFEVPDDTNGDNIYQVDVQVADSDNTATTQAITVTVTNDDEFPVISAATNTNVAENQNSVLTIGSSDVDGGVPMYSISGGADAELFAMDAINGILTFQLAPNFENPTDTNVDNVYELTVQVEDGDGDTAIRMISVNVSNVNEDPLITSVSNVSASENQTDVLSVTGIDEDGDPALYSVSGGVDAEKFDIDRLSGALAFKIQPDFESPRSAGDSNTYEVTIEVNDSNGGLGTQAITVNVLDENDAPIVNRQLSNQILDIDSALSVGGDSFSDQDSDDLVYSMTLIDGRPLPAWISFDPDTTDLRLGVPPSESVTEQLLLIAEDNRGGTAQMTFDVQFIKTIEEIEPPLQAAEPTIPDSTTILPSEAINLNQATSLPKSIKQPSAVSESSYSTSELGLASEDSIEALASVSAEMMSELMSNGVSNILGRGDGDEDQRSVLRNNNLSEYLAGQASERNITPEAYIAINVFDDSVNIASLFAMAQLEDPEMYTSLSDGFKKQREEIDAQINASRGVIGSAITTTSGLSVGYILYLLRGGAIMSSMLTSLPAWRFVDPLPILGSYEDPIDGDSESLQSIVGGSTGTP